MATDPTVNGDRLSEAYNTDELPKSLYKRIKKCVAYEIVEGKTITKVQIICIAYILVTDTGQYIWKTATHVGRGWKITRPGPTSRLTLSRNDLTFGNGSIYLAKGDTLSVIKNSSSRKMIFPT